MPRVIHFDIPADDPKRAVAFYRQVFGWNITDWEGPSEYWLAVTGPDGEPGINGGIGRRSAPGQGVINTISVDSADSSAAAIVANSGEVMGPKEAVPGVGWLVFCRDTENNAFCIMQMDPNAR